MPMSLIRQYWFYISSPRFDPYTVDCTIDPYQHPVQHPVPTPHPPHSYSSLVLLVFRDDFPCWRLALLISIVCLFLSSIPLFRRPIVVFPSLSYKKHCVCLASVSTGLWEMFWVYLHWLSPSSTCYQPHANRYLLHETCYLLHTNLLSTLFILFFKPVFHLSSLLVKFLGLEGQWGGCSSRALTSGVCQASDWSVCPADEGCPCDTLTWSVFSASTKYFINPVLVQVLVLLFVSQSDILSAVKVRTPWALLTPIQTLSIDTKLEKLEKI